MDIKSKEALNAQVEFNKLEQINKIEKKLHRLSFIPLYCFACLVLAYFGLNWNNTPSNAILILAATVGIIGQSNVQRTDLLKKLFELKYSKTQIQ